MEVTWRLLRESINNLKNVAVGGVDFSLAGNGGSDCINFLPAYQRCLETVVFTSLGLCGIYYSMGGLEWHTSHESTNNVRKEYANGNGLTNGNAELINNIPANPSHSDQKMALFFRSILLRLSTISRHFTAHKNAFFKFYAGIFLIELIYKAITRTAIFLLNPCHVCTALQLVLLRFRDEKRRPWTQQLFRFHLYTVPGALIALMFPILNTRLMVGEVFIYFVQHSLILITPIHLMSTTDVYKPEPLTNVSWPMFKICSTAFELYITIHGKMDFILNTYFFHFLPFEVSDDWKKAITSKAVDLVRWADWFCKAQDARKFFDNHTSFFMAELVR
ncbi:TMEM164 family domain-containing protein [Ditylenchus destructor]|nr:TMEM164 family domain-containing protein [Ditylenchus destructor]